MAILKTIERSISKIIPHEHSAAKRAAMGAVKEQVDYYQQSKQEMMKQNAEVSNQKHLEQQKIQEKQIRSMRRNYRAPGFLGTDTNSGVSDTLG